MASASAVDLPLLCVPFLWLSSRCSECSHFSFHRHHTGFQVRFLSGHSRRAYDSMTCHRLFRRQQRHVEAQPAHRGPSDLRSMHCFFLFFLIGLPSRLAPPSSLPWLHLYLYLLNNLPPSTQSYLRKISIVCSTHHVLVDKPRSCRSEQLRSTLTGKNQRYPASYRSYHCPCRGRNLCSIDSCQCLSCWTFSWNVSLCCACEPAGIMLNMMCRIAWSDLFDVCYLLPIRPYPTLSILNNLQSSFLHI